MKGSSMDDKAACWRLGKSHMDIAKEQSQVKNRVQWLSSKSCLWSQETVLEDTFDKSGAANNPAISALKSWTLRRKDGLLDNPLFFEINLLTSEKNMNAVKLCKIAWLTGNARWEGFVVTNTLRKRCMCNPCQSCCSCLTHTTPACDGLPCLEQSEFTDLMLCFHLAKVLKALQHLVFHVRGARFKVNHALALSFCKSKNS